ncbi:UDP-N-acetylmuramoyl-L-alanyl-D-glutamate--2,6-diaminopimelate ligase [Pseudokineococcus lusitanus]|uniref:UDP-N-acetylmuramoyl-L-alanyl-D-glutamate--2,6-diaminopimelate ligase n=1 Tax=Pseudokineococcus lusitanus TaxID=763993 RepID=A0A3N1HL79_9ACTN|nr:UDP-N-acetylmuramoyl-L-alanyl-D-glutamate--2,6-diaminopimelate ligase [Pseudokineococcus lusitanus]ROP43092.1 UDP-N-acetylmuramoylalanyl-D-glutamate--2,6-diaminopimelate ligase [Pseudokineococcus lusitanus]
MADRAAASTPSTPLADLAAAVPGGRLVGADDGRGPDVTGVTLDSRAVARGDLYAALPGARAHGADFAHDARAAGAVAVLTDAEGERRLRAAGQDLPVVVAPDPRAVVGDLAARVHRTGTHRGDGPGPLLLGITGTNGKTTTAYLLEGALAAAGRTTGLVGTVETRVAGEVVASARTTPEAPVLHALLARMARAGVDVAALEVSSHALSLHRVDGLVVDVAGFTNLSQDHLDFHDGMEDYFAAKASLFTPERSRRGVVVVDDAWGRRLAQQASVPVTTVATAAGTPADWTAEVAPDGVGPTGTDFVLAGPDGARLLLRAPLPGAFNVANTALAAVVLLEAGLAADEVVGGLSQAGSVPGRLELVAPPAAPDGTPLAALPRVLVDYAHTPDAVAAALAAVRPSTAGRLVVVLGAGGDRDRGKRGPMGAAAARAADVVVVTDDNPRSEEPAAVRAAVLAGATSPGGRDPLAPPAPATVLEVGDRARALRAALDAAGPDGTVLVAGKGHERGQEVAGVVHPFDDRDEVRAALAAAAAGGSESEDA